MTLSKLRRMLQERWEPSIHCYRRLVTRPMLVLFFPWSAPPDRIWYAVYGFHESTWHNNSCYGKWVNNRRDFRYAAVRPGNEVMGRTRRHQKSLSLPAWRTAYCILGLICIGKMHRRKRNWPGLGWSRATSRWYGEEQQRATLPFRHLLLMDGNFLRKKGYIHLFDVFISQLLKQ